MSDTNPPSPEPEDRSAHIRPTLDPKLLAQLAEVLQDTTETLRRVFLSMPLVPVTMQDATGDKFVAVCAQHDLGNLAGPDAAAYRAIAAYLTMTYGTAVDVALDTTHSPDGPQANRELDDLRLEALGLDTQERSLGAIPGFSFAADVRDAIDEPGMARAFKTFLGSAWRAAQRGGYEGWSSAIDDITEMAQHPSLSAVVHQAVPSLATEQHFGTPE